MEPYWIFTAADNSIDFVGALIYATALFYSIKYLCINNINMPGKILYGIISVICVLHIVQVMSQLYFGGPVSWTFRTWDIINYITSVLLLMFAQRLHSREKNNV